MSVPRASWSAARCRRAALGAAIGALSLTGCAGSDDKKAASQGPADRTQPSEAGARAALREYASALTSSDGDKICDLLDPTSPAMKSTTIQRCPKETARLKNALTPEAQARYRQQTLKLKPVVKGNVATLPGKTGPALRYIDGRWYVIPVPAKGASPTS